LSPPINEEGGGRLFFFTGVNGVRWKSPVTPGDDLIMEMSLVGFDERLGFATMTGKAYVGGRVFLLLLFNIFYVHVFTFFNFCNFMLKKNKLTKKYKLLNIVTINA
jgi:hypothetical protein